MKKYLVLGILFTFGLLTLYAEELYYYGGGEKIIVNKCKDRLSVKWGETAWYNNGKPYAYDSDWNLLWSKALQKNPNKEELNGGKKKIRVGVQYMKYYLLPYYTAPAEIKGYFIGAQFYYSLTSNFASSFECLYTSKLCAEYLLVFPMDRLYYLSDVVLFTGRICLCSNISLFYSTPYISVGFVICQATNVADFMGGGKKYHRFPLQLGVSYLTGIDFHLWDPFIIGVRANLLKLQIKEKGVRIYNLNRVAIEICFKWDGIKIGRRSK